MVNITGLDKNYLTHKMVLKQFESKVDKTLGRKRRKPKYDHEVVSALKDL
jgi:hypothetical protein